VFYVDHLVASSRQLGQHTKKRVQQSGDSDERRSLMSATSCQTGKPVLYYAHSGITEHTAGTRFALRRATSEVPVALKLCVLTFGASRQADRRHSAQTAVGAAGIQRYPQGPSYMDPTE